MVNDRKYEVSQVLGMVSFYRRLENTAAELRSPDENVRVFAAQSILENLIPGFLDVMVPEEVRTKVDITQIIYDAKGVLGLERSGRGCA